VQTALDIVNAMLEDIDADLPSHKSEVRILPTDDPRRFDVTLLTGFDPVYIGTLGCQGSVWKPVEVMPGVGRELRAKLHFVGPDKEAVAMTMVQTLRPVWKRLITGHLMNQMESVIQPDAALVQKIAEIIEDGLKQHGIQRGTVPDTDTAEAYISQTNAALRKYRAAIDGVHKSAAGSYGGGWILIRPNSSILCEPNELRRVIAHELVHRTQDERSKGKGLGGHHDHYSHSEAMAYARDAAEMMREAGLSAADVNRVTVASNPRLFKIFKFYRSNQEWWRIFLEYLARYLRPVSECLESAAEEIAKEAEKAEKPTSHEQAEAGNYKKGHVSVQGLEIAIENAEGSTRSGTGKDGKTWKVTMPAHYGYIKGTQGKDKDHLDVYIGPEPDGMMAFVVNQRRQEGGFDEHKIMLGFKTKDDAIATYDRAFSGSLGPKLRETVVSTTVDKLKEWIASGNTKKPFEGIVESLLEEDDNGFDALKALSLRASQGAVPGTEFNIGFAISTSDEHMIEMRANDDAIEVDWAAVNDAIPIIERNAMTVLEEQGIRCRAEGHDSHGDLVGSAWVQAGTGGVAIVQQFIDAGESFRTSSGTIDFIQQGLAHRLYQGVPENIAALIDVDISFFDLDAVENPDPLADIEESDDTKALAMRTPMRDPQVWGELKIGDVLFVPETGSYERIDGYQDGHGTSYQDVTGKLVYDSDYVQFRLYAQFSPAYAYGHFVQHLRSDPRHGLLGAQLVELDDTSDEALWKLVDEEMHRNGTTPEELAQSRADHQARQAARPPEEVDAQRRYDQMMGRVPEPPQNESEEIDPKSFVNRPELSPQWPPGAVQKVVSSAARCMQLWFRQDYKHYLSDHEFLSDLSDAVSDFSGEIDANDITSENPFEAAVAHHKMLSDLCESYLKKWFEGKQLGDYQRAHMKVWREIAAGMAKAIMPHVKVHSL
jgi:hypothetical protein